MQNNDNADNDTVEEFDSIKTEEELLGYLTAMKNNHNSTQCMKMMTDFMELWKTAPGSRKSHHNWEGGYLDHVCDAISIGVIMYVEFQNNILKLPFNMDDVVLVLFLHDIEKPFKYKDCKQCEKEDCCEDCLDTKLQLKTKSGRANFRLDLIAKYDIQLTEQHQNALKYIEGENDDYVAGERTMNELAAFCHICDVASARIYHSKKL